MRYTTTVDGGDIASAYWCKTCDEIIDKTYDYHDLQDGIQFGEVKERDVPFWESVNLKHQQMEANNESKYTNNKN
ncbi:hypothetical protein CHI07_17030 [Paenibacillus sp. 7884-2]|nr:hypothetical protein CHI07_17030 [Paenibacillus sp. 7884-2]